MNSTTTLFKEEFILAMEANERLLGHLEKYIDFIQENNLTMEFNNFCKGYRKEQV